MLIIACTYTLISYDIVCIHVHVCVYMYIVRIIILLDVFACMEERSIGQVELTFNKDSSKRNTEVHNVQ